VTERVQDLVLLPRRVVHQPTPELHPGGDCGACVLAGLTDYSIEDVYRKLDPKHDTPKSFYRGSMLEALRIAKWERGRIRSYIETCPTWAPHPGMRAWGNPSWMVSGQWLQYVTMALEAGYYAITQVDAEKKGPLGGGTNHWVMLCGTRVFWKDDCGEYQVLVSCSSRSTPDEEWVECGPFLQERGGFDVILARPEK
jgi:hypothetical protein